MKQGFKFGARWIGVLPISIVAGILVTFPLHWILYQTLSGGESPFITPYPELPERVLSPFFVSIIVVWVGSKVAPTNKFMTAITLSVIWIIFTGVIFAMAYFGVQVGKVQYSLVAAPFPIIMGVLGSIIGVYIVRTDLRKEQKEVVKEKEVLPEERVESSNNAYTTDLMNLIFIAIFVLSLYYLVVRNIFFAFLFCFNVFLIVFSWKEKLYTTLHMKINLAKNIVMAVVLLIGLLNQALGFYVTIFCLGLQMLESIRHFIKAHLLVKINQNL